MKVEYRYLTVFKTTLAAAYGVSLGTFNKWLYSAQDAQLVPILRPRTKIPPGVVRKLVEHLGEMEDESLVRKQIEA